ncbi:hypothetical protein V6N13_113670 [Hibiscus sabdariffa]
MENNSSDNEDKFEFDGDDLTWTQVGKAIRAHDPIYLTKASRNPPSAFVKGKDVVLVLQPLPQNQLIKP